MQTLKTNKEITHAELAKLNDKLEHVLATFKSDKSNVTLTHELRIGAAIVLNRYRVNKNGWNQCDTTDLKQAIEVFNSLIDK